MHWRSLIFHLVSLTRRLAYVGAHYTGWSSETNWIHDTCTYNRLSTQPYIKSQVGSYSPHVSILTHIYNFLTKWCGTATWDLGATCHGSIDNMMYTMHHPVRMDTPWGTQLGSDWGLKVLPSAISREHQVINSRKVFPLLINVNNNCTFYIDQNGCIHQTDVAKKTWRCGNVFVWRSENAPLTATTFQYAWESQWPCTDISVKCTLTRRYT